MKNVVFTHASPFFSIPYFSKLYAIWWMAWTVWPNTVWLLSTTAMIFGHGVVAKHCVAFVNNHDDFWPWRCGC
jgi:hypothetical protein